MSEYAECFSENDVDKLIEVLERYPDAEIDINLAHRVAEILEREVAIATGVDDDDEPAAPPHHLVEAKILEMAAVG
jgi:hypothetical protein